MKNFPSSGEIEVFTVGLLSPCFGSQLVQCCSAGASHTAQSYSQRLQVLPEIDLSLFSWQLITSSLPSHKIPQAPRETSQVQHKSCRKWESHGKHHVCFFLYINYTYAVSEDSVCFLEQVCVHTCLPQSQQNKASAWLQT